MTISKNDAVKHIGCEDTLTDSNYFNTIYKEACEITAYLCKLYNIDPHGTVTVSGVKIPTILCHQDSYKLGFGSNHGDIYHWFNKFGKSMVTARDDVAKLLNKKPIVVEPPKKEEDDEMLSYDQWKAYMNQYLKELAKEPADDYAKQYIKSCVDAGIMVNTGTPEAPAIERPKAFLTRQEAAIIQAQALKK